MSVKNDIVKEIEARVARKKALAKEISREKTIAHLVTEFFDLLEGVKAIDEIGMFQRSALNLLEHKLRDFDKSVRVKYKRDEELVEIHWSKAYCELTGYEQVLVIDKATAAFDKYFEEL